MEWTKKMYFFFPLFLSIFYFLSSFNCRVLLLVVSLLIHLEARLQNLLSNQAWPELTNSLSDKYQVWWVLPLGTQLGCKTEPSQQQKWDYKAENLRPNLLLQNRLRSVLGDRLILIILFIFSLVNMFYGARQI